ncbi:MAG: hypothetical protein C4523_01815 [Myxococcales bacterium]|nr:MAG: hypothetical protein C4523_01815 [Myxococcales bacterium]
MLVNARSEPTPTLPTLPPEVYVDPAEGERFWRELEDGREVTLRALGDSMRPVFPNGTIFIIRRAEPRDLQAGDIVLLRWGDRARLHRFIRWFDPGRHFLVTKGDWLNGLDDPWPRAALCGRAVGYVDGGKIRRLDAPLPRLLGRGAALVSKPVGRALAVWRALRRRPG